MNKNMVYVVILAVSCTLAGVVVGAGIAKKTNLPWPCPGRPSFTDRAESFMQHGPRGMRDGHFGKHGPRGFQDNGGKEIFKMLSDKLSLNNDQQAKVREVLEKTRQEIDKVGKDVRDAMAEIKEKSDKQIMEVLNVEQQKKFKILIDEFKKKCGLDFSKERRGPMRRYNQRPGEELPPPQDE
jgi:Spy/CpxP family protein refolding chaperone